MDIPPQLPKPKLCLLRKWETFAGYGFNLHSEKGKPGQFIGKVDPNSPADLGGLCPRDMLIEVNGINVEDSSHNMVVGRVKSIPDRVELLVCHQDTYKYSKENGIQLSSAMLNIDEFTTPSSQPTAEELAARNEKAQAAEVTTNGNDSRSNDATDNSTTDAAAAAAAAASLQAAVDAAGGAEFEEVRQEDLPARLRNVELGQQRSSGPSSSAEGSPRPSSSKRSSPPPSFTVQAAAAPAAAAPAAAAAAPPAASPAAPEAAKPKQQQQQPQQSKQNQQQPSQQQDPVAGVSLDEVRARIGQNKRNQVKMNSGTFSEKYSVFQSL